MVRWVGPSRRAATLYGVAITCCVLAFLVGMVAVWRIAEGLGMPYILLVPQISAVILGLTLGKVVLTLIEEIPKVKIDLHGLTPDFGPRKGRTTLWFDVCRIERDGFLVTFHAGAESLTLDTRMLDSRPEDLMAFQPQERS